MIRKYKEKLKKHFQDVLEIKTSPDSVASGFALGSLIAILPTFGLGVFIGVVIILIFKKISKVSMFIAFAVWNPIVLALLYPLEYKIGYTILRSFPVQRFRIEAYNQIFTYTSRFLLGNLILAIVVAFAGYCIIYYCLKHYRKHK